MLGGSDGSCAEDVAIGEGSFAKSSVLLAARGLGQLRHSGDPRTKCPVRNPKWPKNLAGIVADDSIRLYPVPLLAGPGRVENPSYES